MLRERSEVSRTYSTETRVPAPDTAQVNQIIVRLSRDSWPDSLRLTVYLERTEDGVNWMPVARVTDVGGDILDDGVLRTHLEWRHCWREATKPGRMAIRIVPSEPFNTEISFAVDDEVVSRGSRNR